MFGGKLSTLPQETGPPCVNTSAIFDLANILLWHWLMVASFTGWCVGEVFSPRVSCGLHRCRVASTGIVWPSPMSFGLYWCRVASTGVLWPLPVSCGLYRHRVTVAMVVLIILQVVKSYLHVILRTGSFVFQLIAADELFCT